MLSVNEINLLKAQNEGLRKQNAELQTENKYLQMRCNNARQALSEVEDLIEAAVDIDRTKTMAASLNCLYKALEIIKNE